MNERGPPRRLNSPAVDTVDTELAGEAYQRYLDQEANAAKIAELEDGHRQNSHSE
jgi:hypothetical protein